MEYVNVEFKNNCIGYINKNGVIFKEDEYFNSLFGLIKGNNLTTEEAGKNYENLSFSYKTLKISYSNITKFIISTGQEKTYEIQKEMKGRYLYLNDKLKDIKEVELNLPISLNDTTILEIKELDGNIFYRIKNSDTSMWFFDCFIPIKNNWFSYEDLEDKIGIVIEFS
jgi:hypothetical protein